MTFLKIRESSNPVRNRALKHFNTVRHTIRKDVRESIEQNQVVYCGDNIVLRRLANGRMIYLDMRDASLAPHIAMSGYWEPHVSELLARLVRPGDVVFDVGANVGFHSLMIRDRVLASNGQLHVFEPNPEMFRLLRRSFAANAFWEGIHLEEVALSDRISEETLTLYEDWWGGARLQAPEDLASSDHAWAAEAVVRKQFTVDATTVDAYCEKMGVSSVGLMKIDTEGHEDAVFRGMAKTIARSDRLRIVLEFTFGAYQDPDGFWNDLSSVFPYRYLVDRSGELTRVDKVTDLMAKVGIELADVLFSMVEEGTPGA